MKIAIITFSDFNTNYGSMLQAFSLKTFLEKKGHQITFIRYREYNNVFVNKTNKEKAVLLGKKLVLDLYAKLKEKDILLTKQNFESFKESNFTYTNLFTSNEEITSLLDEFDFYICGSDQIWNLECLGGLRLPYFLDFVNIKNKKIAYAASMGGYHFKKDEIKEISRLLDGIGYISVRERENVQEVSCLTTNTVHHAVDPVFLLSKDEWGEIVPDSPIKGDYGVCYFVRRSKLGKKIVKNLKKTYNIPIYNLSDNMIYIGGTSTKYISAGPLEFLSIIKGAKYTVGTSFHLAAFSVLFNKPFFIIGLETNQARICNILELVDLQGNYITEYSDYIEKVKNLFKQNQNIFKLYALINKSKDFLINALKE